MKFGKNDEAVSPVIGVILMVAITVILAAVIAAFVFGMGAPTKAPQTSLSIKADSASGVTITQSGGDPLVTGENKITIFNASTSPEQLMVGTVTGVSTDVQINNVNLTAFDTAGQLTLAPGMSISNATLYPKGAIIDVKILNVPSGQFITTARVSVI